MAALTISIKRDEFLGLGALALLDEAVNGARMISPSQRDC
jgi:hypothetical protein